MGFKVEMQQLEPKLSVDGGQSGPNGARVSCSAFERESDGDRGQRQHARRCPENQLLQHKVSHEHQCIKDLDWRL